MFKKTIKFTDFNGEEQTKDFYFHMSKAELLSMTAQGDEMTARLKRIIATQDGGEILKEFRALVQMACGIRSEDGQRFIKTPEAQSELLDSPAYDELLFELCTEANASVDFVTKLIPQKMQDEMKAQLQKQQNVVELPEDKIPAWIREDRNPTQTELQAMTPEELQLAFQRRK